MQKTLTVNGKRFAAKQIVSLFDKKVMTNGGDYIIILNGRRYFANYRKIQDNFFAPVCEKIEANAISLMPDNGFFTWDIWMRVQY